MSAAFHKDTIETYVKLLDQEAEKLGPGCWHAEASELIAEMYEHIKALEALVPSGEAIPNAGRHIGGNGNPASYGVADRPKPSGSRAIPQFGVTEKARS